MMNEPIGELDLLQRLNKAGCEFLVSVPVLEGATTKILSPEQALRFLNPNTRDAVFAELLQLSLLEYREWRDSRGCVFCSGFTQKNQRCKNYVVGGTSLSPELWLELHEHGGYCSAHGG